MYAATPWVQSAVFHLVKSFRKRTTRNGQSLYMPCSHSCIKTQQAAQHSSSNRQVNTIVIYIQCMFGYRLYHRNNNIHWKMALSAVWKVANIRQFLCRATRTWWPLISSYHGNNDIHWKWHYIPTMDRVQTVRLVDEMPQSCRESLYAPLVSISASPQHLTSTRWFSCYC